ncbi:MAG: ferritin family protein [Phycisphaerae bacterium]|nr:ferritin family protein [Phycisphaerae bacterium]
MPHSADYALQIAMQLERLGQMFYHSLAQSCGDEKLADFANSLAEEEKKHLWTFEKMYHSLPIESCGQKLTQDQIAATAGKFYKLILPGAEEVRQVASSGDTAKTLAMAIQMEADSIAYYSDMTPVLKEDVIVLKAIIAEEKRHLAKLRTWRDNL